MVTPEVHETHAGISPFHVHLFHRTNGIPDSISTAHLDPSLHLAFALANGDADIERHIRRAHAYDAASISRRDEHGMTPVFFAAILNNCTAVRVLLELGVTDDLSSLQNPDRLTPLRAVQLNMGGKSLEERQPIIKLLQQAMLPFKPLAECTCGCCDDGWLSHRMRKLLLGMCFIKRIRIYNYTISYT